MTEVELYVSIWINFKCKPKKKSTNVEHSVYLKFKNMQINTTLCTDIYICNLTYTVKCMRETDKYQS